MNLEFGRFMDCTEAKNLFVDHILRELAPDSEQLRKLEAHLACCRVCREEYESNKWAVGFIEAHKAEFAEAIEAVESKAVSQEELERSWRGIKAKLDKLEAQETKEKPGKIYRLLVKVSAAAACLALCVSAYLMLFKPARTEKSARSQVVSVPADTIRIQMLSDDGSTLIPAGRQIASVDSLKTLVINEKHRIVLNSDTTVSLGPLEQNNRVGCLVKLASGQIYAHVEHDGNPFVIATAHGRAVITGTTFDIKATDRSTTLVVADGSIKFESEKGVVEVAAGQVSRIIANSAPTRPVSCDTTELTAWATEYELRTAIAKIGSYSETYDLTDLWISAISGLIDLKSVVYADWIEEKRSWFQREFPWIFQLQSALAAEGIEVDYPQLLISSGDIWQFVFPETSPQQIPILHFGSLYKVASKYGFDEQWLTANIPAAGFAIDEPTTVNSRFAGLKAFEAWVSCFEQMRKSTETPDSGTILSSIHAGAYLANTRTLAWFSINNGRHALRPEDENQVLDLLQTEVNTANELIGRVIGLFAASAEQPCDECHGMLDGIIEGISTITSIEERILEYEARK